MLHLRSTGYTIDLLVSCSSAERLEAYRMENARLRVVANTVVVRRSFGWTLAVLRRAPWSLAWRSTTSADRRTIKHGLAGSYDIVLIEHLKSLALYDAAATSIVADATYLRSHNIESVFYERLSRAQRPGWKSLFFLSEGKRYKHLEADFLKKRSIDKVLYISRDDMQMERFVEPHQRHWLPTWFDPPPAGGPGFKSRKNVILYVGNLDSIDNVVSVEKLFAIVSPLLRQSTMRFMVAGRKHDGRATGLHVDRQIEYVFNVSDEELRVLYDQAKLFFCYSSNNAGVKTKLLEAVSRNLPVLANSDGAVGSGLENDIFCMGCGDAALQETRSFIERMMHSESAWQAYQQLQFDAAKKFQLFVTDRHRAIFNR